MRDHEHRGVHDSRCTRPDEPDEPPGRVHRWQHDLVEGERSLAYDQDGLRTGARGLREVSRAAADAGAALARAVLQPVVFGRTAAAPVFAAALGAARAAQARGSGTSRNGRPGWPAGVT